MSLYVKAFRNEKLSGFGITDGRKWFFWLYETEREATFVCERIKQSGYIVTNIAYNEPLSKAPLREVKPGVFAPIIHS